MNKTCKDCIHYDVCLLHEDNFIDDANKNGFCGKHKSKSRYIELPCAVGDTVYVITSDSPTGIEETKVSQIKTKVKENGKISYRISAPCVYDTWGEAHWTFCAFEFGKTVFLTRKEAEQALKGGVQE